MKGIDRLGWLTGSLFAAMVGVGIAAAVVSAAVTGGLLVPESSAQVTLAGLAGSIKCDGPLLLDITRCQGATTLFPGNLDLCGDGKYERVVIRGCLTPDGLHLPIWDIEPYTLEKRSSK